MKIKYAAGLSDKTGIREETFHLGNQKLNVLDLLKAVSRKHSLGITDKNKPRPYILLTVNNHLIFDTKTLLKDEDIVMISYIPTGG